MSQLSYVAGADLPDAQLKVRNGDETYPDFSSGYTFQIKVAPAGSTTASFTKSTGITGAAGSATAANVVVAWSTSGELNSLSPGFYTLMLFVTRTSDSKTWPVPYSLEITEAIS